MGEIARPHCLVFDSGMGGLTVVEALQRLGFQGTISYAADTGFFPYGDKPDDVLAARIVAFAEAVCARAKPDIFVIACNTASTIALELVREQLSIPIVGTVPAIKPAAEHTKSRTIGILATPGTLRRSYTDALIDDFATDCRVLRYGSVALVELAERFAAGLDVPDTEIEAELIALLRQPGGGDIDTVVLACTHFPLLRPRLEALAPEGVRFIDSGEAIARRTLSLLDQKPSKNKEQAALGHVYLSSQPTEERPHRLSEVTRRLGFQSVLQLEID